MSNYSFSHAKTLRFSCPTTTTPFHMAKDPFLHVQILLSTCTTIPSYKSNYYFRSGTSDTLKLREFEELISSGFCRETQEVVQLPFQTVVFESIEGKGDILMENVNTQI